MSAFIGPIHYWLYGKIRLVGQREDYLFARATALCGDTAEEAREQVRQSYGAPLPDRDLIELIDHGNIHGWLQRQIKLAETREAAFVQELLAACGDAAAELIGQAFADHDKMTGEGAAAQGRYDTVTAPGIYKALNDYFLNGMPCDQADTVVASAADRLLWRTDACLQEPNWQRAGADTKTMARFYRAWLAGFVAGINPAFAYRQTPPVQATENAATVHEIYRQ